ncbi:lipocalin family protein [uncultured Aquimarina sp.]|uniref:lipocalin family protein n=1 Tax=uncultured Aquimarina sp. TaxID=575652 RepID=UPI002621ED62|nr:lipocalin family protein [uncultured Aquimarina sp.]
MKTNFFLFAISFALFFSSCSSDDDNSGDNGGDPTTVSLVGTWKLTAATAAQSVDLNMDGTVSDNLLEELPCFEDTIMVNDDNTYDQNVEEVVVNVEMVGPLVVVTADCTGTTLNETGTWSLDGDKLTFTPTGMDPKEVTITLIETTLSFTDAVEDLGDVALVFTRQ